MTRFLYSFSHLYILNLQMDVQTDPHVTIPVLEEVEVMTSENQTVDGNYDNNHAMPCL